MDPADDDRPIAEPSRTLPILGCVAPDGRVTLCCPFAARVADGAPALPHDPGEA
jgi:hypothetical protein